MRTGLMLIITTNIICDIFTQQTKTYIEAYTTFVSQSYNILQERLTKSINKVTFIDAKCKESIQATYLNSAHSKEYFSKTISHSSKHDNDLSTFNSCVNKKIRLSENSNSNDDHDTKFTFFLIELRINMHHLKDDYDEAILPLNHSYSVYGLCFIEDCKETKDIRNLLYDINQETNLFSGLKEIDDIKIIRINEALFYSHPLRLIPVLVLIIHLIISSWRSVWFCFRKCFKETKGFNDFSRCFRFSENAELLLNYKILSSKINNNSGLTYIRGIKGVFLLLMVLGFVFQIVLNSPIHLKEQQVYEDLMSNPWFCFIFVGLRIAPRLLLSCSGYILVFKLMSFLDTYKDITEKTVKDKDNVVDDSDSNPFKKDKDEDDNDDDDQNDDKKEKLMDSLAMYEEEINNKISNVDDKKIPSVKLLLQFIIYQIHYYFICAFFILASIYSIGSIRQLTSTINPSWVYFRNTILLDSSLDKFWKSFLFYQSFTIDFHTHNSNTGEVAITNKELGNLFKYEWMAFNEMLFFILTSIIIFICYRKRYSLMKIVSIVILLLIGIKYSLFAFFNGGTPQLYSTGYYQMQDFGNFFTNPLYNYSFYLIGVLFGLINYTVQNGLIFIEDLPESIKHHSLPIAIAKFFIKQSPPFIYITGFIGFLLIMTLSCSQFIFISSFFPGSLSSFVKNWSINYYYIIDIELIVFLLHWITFGFFIKGDNIFNYFLSQDFWEVENKIYFSFILIVNPVTLILLYQSETRISLDFSDIVFYTLITVILTTFLSALFYCLFESPYKRLIRFAYNYYYNNNIGNRVKQEEEQELIKDKDKDDNKKEE